MTGSDPPDSSVETRLRVSRIIHAAMVVSLVVYAVVVHMLRAVVEWKPVAEPAVVETVRWLLYGLGAAALMGVLLLRSRFVSAKALGEIARRAGTGVALRQLQTRLIVFLAVSETPAVYGLVLFMLGGVLHDFYLLWAASLIGHLALTPKRDLWEEVARVRV